MGNPNHATSYSWPYVGSHILVASCNLRETWKHLPLSALPSDLTLDLFGSLPWISRNSHVNNKPFHIFCYMIDIIRFDFWTRFWVGNPSHFCSVITTILVVNSMCVCAQSLQSCLALRDPMDYSLSGSSVHGISGQEYWSGLPCPPPGYLVDPRIEPRVLWLLRGRQILYCWATREVQ